MASYEKNSENKSVELEKPPVNVTVAACLRAAAALNVLPPKAATKA